MTIEEKIKLILKNVETGIVTPDGAAKVISAMVGNDNIDEECITVNADKIKKTKSDIIKEMTDSIMYDKDDEGNYYFDFPLILKFMKEKNWKWFGETVTEDMMYDFIYKHIKECVDEIVIRGKEEWCIESGGIQVNAYVEENDTISVEVRFIADSGYASYDVDKYKEAVDD